ncbi:phage tail assembly chaperone [Hyphococcus lacteus]|uniref:Phage tail assembly chaperone n=1 Tax=Hyphococcus lacteus TaxID=3143536 RepID=A0ABV3Z031_9PROT
MFGFAVTGLGLSPRDFWNLSVSEWRVLISDARGMGQQDLAHLIHQIEGNKND